MIGASLLSHLCESDSVAQMITKVAKEFGLEASNE